MNSERDSDNEGDKRPKWRISEYWCTRYAGTSNHSKIMCFVDFKSIRLDLPWKYIDRCSLMNNFTVRSGQHTVHLIDLLAKLYGKQLAKVKVAGTLSEWFRIKKGVRQGCVLSPYTCLTS